MGKETSTLTWIVMTSRAKMPAKCWGAYNYQNLAIIELNRARSLGHPRMLSRRARGVNRIITAAYRVHCGRTTKSAGVQIFDDYVQIAHQHNQMVETLREMNQ